jgi:hypothetical protein
MENPFRRKKGGGQPQRVLISPFAISSNTADLEEAFNKLKKDTTKKLKQKSKIPTDEASRSKIALKFVTWYLIFIGAILLLVPIYNSFVLRNVKIEVTNDQPVQTLDIGTTLTQVGTILGAPLGFVVGYYFKEKNVKKD